MPYLNIHWKGHPHRRFPRIRVASSTHGASISSRSLSQVAAKEVLTRPLGSSLERERKKQQSKTRVRRCRGRSSRSSSAVYQARSPTFQRPREYSKVFVGWEIPKARTGSEFADEKCRLRTSKPKRKAGARSRKSSSHRNTLHTAIRSADGASGSACRKSKAPKQESGGLYSLRHITEVPLYWSSITPAVERRSSFGPDRSRTHFARNPGCEYVHAGPLETVSNCKTIDIEQRHGWSRTYDSRIDPKSQVATFAKLAPPSRPAPTIPKGSFKCKQPPSLKNSSKAHSIPLEKVETDSTTPSMRSIIQSVLSDTSSRSPSQRKALKRFTKELKLHLQATHILPRQSLIASASSTTIYTIKELTPYHAEFQTAGLAVTSEEQRGKTKLGSASLPSFPPPKDGSSSVKNMARKTAGEPSYGSGSTGTTVMGWTPPHEKSYPRPQADRRRISSGSEHTVMEFTPADEVVAPMRPLPNTISSTPSKKSLPWLRRPQSSPETSPTTSLKRAAVTKGDNDQLSTPPRSRANTFPVSNLLEEDRGKPTRRNEKNEQSLDYLKFSTSTNIKNLVKAQPARENKSPVATINQESLQPLCTQCAVKLVPYAAEGVQKPKPEYLSVSKPRLTHTCTQSSFQCQQCYAYGQKSVTVLHEQASLSPEECYELSRQSTRPIIPAGQMTYLAEQAVPSLEQVVEELVKKHQVSQEKVTRRKVVEKTIEDYAREFTVADPVKRPSLEPKITQTQRECPKQAPSSNSHGSNRARDEDLTSTSTSLLSSQPDRAPVSYKKIFRGLQVATAAACDEDTDKWIEEITGLGVRGFLAGLSTFDGLGVTTLARVAKRAAKQRREQVNIWEDLWEKNLADAEADKYGEWEDIVDADGAARKGVAR